MTNDNWLKYLTNTKEKNYNLEHVNKVKDINNHLVYEYINRCLDILEHKKVNKEVYYYVSETLKWSDVAKTGGKEERKKWIHNHFDLFAHNVGSSQIYVMDNKNYDEVVRVLIRTHGLIGQYIRGEVSLSSNFELYELIEKKLIDKNTLKEVLIVLNECIIRGVSDSLYERIEKEVINVINLIINNQFDKQYTVKERMHKLNPNITKDEEKYFDDATIVDELNKVFNRFDLWYFESALGSFSLLEQIKILFIIDKLTSSNISYITFELVMKNFYIDYNDSKVINIYKKRIVEATLSEMTIEDILNGKIIENPHIKFVVKRRKQSLAFDFVFSKVASKLIEFCEVAYTSNSIYNKAVYLLYDLLGFRKDEYDRFYNEIDYLKTMNSSVNGKKIILNYLVGKNILDVGPGGGVLMDLIEETNPKYNVYGIDLASNVIEELSRKKIKEKRHWHLIQGDALNINEYFKKGSIDTIIYSSIIHELFSYIEYNGKKYNIDTVIKTLKSAYDIIPKGGRIIIRDGIKTEPEDEYRIVEFNNISDIKILDDYCHDFKGRHIKYEKLSKNKVKMLVNDAMEFLYTYTWGEEAYALEVQEQFGYLTPSAYVKLIEENLKDSKIVECRSFLQKGYERNLLNKITIYDESGNITKLPNSTCIIVIEKG